jgi:hypothetical protein
MVGAPAETKDTLTALRMGGMIDRVRCLPIFAGLLTIMVGGGEGADGHGARGRSDDRNVTYAPNGPSGCGLGGTHGGTRLRSESRLSGMKPGKANTIFYRAPYQGP